MFNLNKMFPEEKRRKLKEENNYRNYKDFLRDKYTCKSQLKEFRNYLNQKMDNKLRNYEDFSMEISKEEIIKKYGETIYLLLFTNNLPNYIKKFLENENIDNIPVKIKSVFRRFKKLDLITIEYNQIEIEINIFTKKIKNVKFNRIEKSPLKNKNKNNYILVEEDMIVKDLFKLQYIKNQTKEDEKERYMEKLKKIGIIPIKIKRTLF